MNISPLLSTAASIRDEKARYANTANRVGTLLYKMCLAMADTDATASADHPITQGLGQWLTSHDNLTTLDALNAALDAMTADTPQGLHCFKCFGIPVLTYFGVLVKDTKRYVQIAVGAFTLNTQGSALASINDTASTRNVIVRYFNGTKWQPWQPLQPQKQTSYSGYSGSYVYSEGTTDNTRTILSSKFWIYQHTDRNKFLRFKHWGAPNDTEQTAYSQVMLPNAWTGGNGLLRYDIYKRLDGFNLFEQNSTATEVRVVTPIFTTGGTRELIISQATSAKAGVMTAAQATQLAALNGGITQIKSGGKMVFRTLAGDKVIETHSDHVGEEVSLSDFEHSTLTNYAEGDPIELFMTKGAYGVPAQNFMIWFGCRSNGALLRYDFKTIAGMEPLALYKSGTGDLLHFWTLTKGHAVAYRGSGGLTPMFRVVPYVMNTADKAVIDRLKANFSS
ncbi:hypothetical protein [Prevotellamassilia timonensis]|uniref:hypothetical protein n=1 Tax=Prevotellamassilia timonensis TaxID=1852370 RepID=UPI0030791523